MITHFACKETKAFFHGKRIAKFMPFARIAMRKLQLLNAATSLEFLRAPPGNKLEALKGDRNGQHSIRINAQWRICFIWQAGHAHQVEIVDYH